MSDEPVLPRLPGPGALVDDKYEIVGVVGRGGMGVVFEAIHRRINQRVALKMLHPHVKEEPGVIERFEREARAAGQLVSPNIARVLDVATSSTGLPYIVMEFLDGRDLEDELEDKKQLPIHDAVDYVLQACAAMREAHALGVIHRDLKPANLFLCPSPEGPIIKILDFGISKITTEVDGRLTAAMTTLGSPVYMSPEQLRGASDVDARTDVWSLGVVLYELLAGQPPFAGTLTSVTASIITDVPPKLAAHRDDVPPGLEAVIMKALQKYPVNRFQDAESFAEALVPFASAASAKWLTARLSNVPPAPSSRRIVSRGADSDKETVAAPSLPSGGLAASTSETRHNFTTGAFERSVRPRTRARLLIGGGIVVAAGATIALVLSLRGSPRPEPIAAGASATASASELAAQIPPVVTPPIASVEAQPVATATAVPVASASARPAPPKAAPKAAPPPKAAAPVTNPLRL